MFDEPRGLKNWGATLADTLHWYPCDDVGFEADDEFLRATDVAAPAALTFAVLCRTGSRRPPPIPGRRFFGLYRVLTSVPGEHVTVALRRSLPGWLVGDYLLTFRVLPADFGSRLIVKVLVRYPFGPLGLVGRLVVPGFDRILWARRLSRIARHAEGEYEARVGYNNRYS